MNNLLSLKKTTSYFLFLALTPTLIKSDLTIELKL